jgi:hypothetical protein
MWQPFRPRRRPDGFERPSAQEEMHQFFNDLHEKGLRAGPSLFFVNLSQFLDAMPFDAKQILARLSVSARQLDSSRTRSAR